MSNEELILVIKKHIRNGMDWLDSIEYLEKNGKKMSDMQFKIIAEQFLDNPLHKHEGVCDDKR